jgi:pyridoxal phosphate enzyme (YggS family)
MSETVLQVEGLRGRLTGVRKQVEQAAKRAGREPEEITLIAVSKTHPTPVLREAILAGAYDLGENRVQEAESKILEIGRHRIRWHLIGHLQSNKARKAVKLFDVIHSVDSIDLAQRLNRVCEESDRRELPILIQVDLAGEKTKSGIREENLEELISEIKTLSRLRLIGLMILPPYFEDTEKVRPFFRRLRELRDELKKQNAFANARGELSMGMSHDFEIAIEEGATFVRVGTAIFGERN